MLEKRIFISCDDHDIKKEMDIFLEKLQKSLQRLVLLVLELIFVVWEKIVILEFTMVQKYVLKKQKQHLNIFNQMKIY